jgi:hypothetical protein
MLFQHLMSVGINLTYGNILYINLPKKNSTAFICFNTVTSNIFSFLGLGCGTLLSSFTGDVPVQFMGMEFYSIQLVLVVRFIIYLIFGIWMVVGWRKFTSDELIEEVEEISEGDRIRREARRTFKKA